MEGTEKKFQGGKKIGIFEQQLKPKSLELENVEEMISYELRLVEKVDMVEWLFGYDKEFLFYSTINGEHLVTKQSHNVFCFSLKRKKAS